MCGEKHAAAVKHGIQHGSPPHVRGKDKRVIVPCVGLRITPACAGKRVTVYRQEITAWDHPRMCGEKYQRHIDMLQGMGSPPHVRGKVSQQDFVGGDERITPACAGKRSTSKIFRHLHWDHPRMCGEKYLIGTGLGDT